MNLVDDRLTRPCTTAARKNVSAIHIVVGIFLLAVMCSTPAAAQQTRETTESAQAIVSETITRLLEEIDKERETLRTDPTRAHALIDKIVAPHLDFERISRLVLGKYWRKATQAQRQRFMGEFRTLLYRTYATAAIEYTEPSIIYLPPKLSQDGKEIIVRSQIPQAGAPNIEMDYRLHWKDGSWKLYDVVIEGVSFVTTYRKTFSPDVRRFGVDGLIDRLVKKNKTGGKT